MWGLYAQDSFRFTDVEHVEKDLRLPQPFGILMKQLAGDELVRILPRDGVNEIDPVQRRDDPKIIRDDAEERIRQREIDENRIGAQVVIVEKVAKKGLLLFLFAGRRRGGVECRLLRRKNLAACLENLRGARQGTGRQQRKPVLPRHAVRGKLPVVLRRDAPPSKA